MITIVTPTLNAASSIAATLQSLAHQRADFEHLVQDGGSKDATLAVVQTYEGMYNLRFRSEPDSGNMDAVRRGFRSTSGDVMAWLNAGDRYFPWTLRTVEEIFSRRPDVDWITGIPSHEFSDGETMWTHSYAPIHLRPLIRRGYYRAGRLGFMQQESMFWRRSLWNKAHGDEVLGRHGQDGDYHLWVAFADHARLWTASAVLACFAHSADQITQKNRDNYLRGCGCNPGSMEPAVLGKLFNRAISQICSASVIRPAFDRVSLGPL